MRRHETHPQHLNSPPSMPTDNKPKSGPTLGTYIAAAAFIISCLSYCLSNKALNFSKKQYYNLNKPFLQFQLVTDSLMTIVPNRPFFIPFRIRNLGKFPVKILRKKVGMRFLETDPGFDSFRSEPLDSSQEIVSDVSIEFDFYSRIIQQSLFDSITVSQKKRIYFFINYEYQNLLTDEISRFEYLIRWENYALGIKILHNENYVIN